MRLQLLSAWGLSLALLAGCANAAPGGADFEPGDGSVGALGASRVQSSSAATLDFVLESEEHGEERYAKDGTLLALYRYEIPVLRVAREDGQVLDAAASAAEKAALDTAAAFNADVAGWLEDTNFPSVLDWAEEDYAQYAKNGQGWWGYYEEEFTHSSWRTERLISIAGTYYSYTGGAHPNSVFMSWNFDLQTGRFLHPAALGADSEEFQAAVTEEILRQADLRAEEEGMAPEELYWEDYRDIAARWPDYAVSFSDRGMTVTFSAYEMASYAAGSQSFELGMSFLKPWLSEDGMLLLGLSEDAEASGKPAP